MVTRSTKLSHIKLIVNVLTCWRTIPRFLLCWKSKDEAPLLFLSCCLQNTGKSLSCLWVIFYRGGISPPNFLLLGRELWCSETLKSKKKKRNTSQIRGWAECYLCAIWGSSLCCPTVPSRWCHKPHSSPPSPSASTASVSRRKETALGSLGERVERCPTVGGADSSTLVVDRLRTSWAGCVCAGLKFCFSTQKYPSLVTVMPLQQWTTHLMCSGHFGRVLSLQGHPYLHSHPSTPTVFTEWVPASQVGHCIPVTPAPVE